METAERNRTCLRVKSRSQPQDLAWMDCGPQVAVTLMSSLYSIVEWLTTNTSLSNTAARSLSKLRRKAPCATFPQLKYLCSSTRTASQASMSILASITFWPITIQTWYTHTVKSISGSTSWPSSWNTGPKESKSSVPQMVICRPMLWLWWS